MTYRHAHESEEVKAYCQSVRARHAQDLLDGLYVKPQWDEKTLAKEVKRFGLIPRKGKALKKRKAQIESHWATVREKARETEAAAKERESRKERKGADSSTNGDNKRRHRIGAMVKCANPQCSETFRTNSENHRYHSYRCRRQHQAKQESKDD